MKSIPTRARPGSPRGPRQQRTVANVARSLAAVGLLMECTGVNNPHALAAIRDGTCARKRGRGASVSDLYAAIWRGEHLAHPAHLEAWATEHAEVRRLIDSPLFALFADGAPSEALFYERAAHPDDHIRLAIQPDFALFPKDLAHALVPMVASGRWSVVELLWNGTVLLAADAPNEVDFSLVQYLAVAMALWGTTPSGRRAGPLLWSLMRRHLLDCLDDGGERLDLDAFNLEARTAEAHGLPRAAIVKKWCYLDRACRPCYFVMNELIVPDATAAWIRRSLPRYTLRPRSPRPANVRAVATVANELHANARSIIDQELGPQLEGWTTPERIRPRRSVSLNRKLMGVPVLAPSLGNRSSPQAYRG